MNIPPFLEKLLLSNEAVFKNATLGMSGQNMVYVPPGKTAVILEVSIESFCNGVSQSFLNLLTDSVSNGYVGGGNVDQSYNEALQKLHYQLQIINDKYTTYINLSNQLNIVTTTTGTPDRYRQSINLEFKAKREELFIYIDRSIYFNIIYPYKYYDEAPATSGLQVVYTTPNVGFLPKIQNIPPQPVTFYKNTFQDYVSSVVVNSTALDRYYPVNHQTNPAFSAEFPQQEYLRFNNALNETTIQQPIGSGTEYDFTQLLTIPFINVKYALLNKRPSDYGLTLPGK